MFPFGRGYSIGLGIRVIDAYKKLCLQSLTEWDTEQEDTLEGYESPSRVFRGKSWYDNNWFILFASDNKQESNNK